MPVLIDYPSIPGVPGTHVGLLSLFIDETGKVVRVRVDSQTLPLEMQDAARSAFMGAAFTPGLVDGLPVRSRIRVEVTFEAGIPTR
jgi:periplasmic protein TonB